MPLDTRIIDGAGSGRTAEVTPDQQLRVLAEIPRQVLGKNDLVQDAWGRQKVVHDYSLFHGVWTYDVPNRLWEEASVGSDGTWTYLTSTGTNANSVNGMLQLGSGTTANLGSAISSKRHPRYQPNRGHLYSTAVIAPVPFANGLRRWGLYEEDNGVYFELEGDGSTWELYCVRKSGGQVKTRHRLDLPGSFDPGKGHVYDIQYQWRGVGNYYFYIDLELVYADNILGTLTELSVQNPANSASYESITYDTGELLLYAGCVDVTSEGGGAEGRTFLSVTTGTSFVSAADTGSAVLAIRIPREVEINSDTVHNTRDAILSKVSSWCRDEAALQIYGGRDTLATNLDGLTWLSISDSNIQYLVGGAGGTLDTAFQSDKSVMELLVNEWEDVEVKNVITNPAEDTAPFHGTPGDIIVIVVQSIAGTDDCAATFYLSEEI